MERKMKNIIAGNHSFLIRGEGKYDEGIVTDIVTQKAYRRYLNLTKDDIWLDIGGYVGDFAIDIAEEVDKVYAFEPENENYGLMLYNIKANGIKNIETFNSALVGNEDKFRTLYLNILKNTAAHSFMVKRGRPSVQVKCRNINEIIDKYKIDKIKLDCECAEYEIIKAIRDISQIKEIVFEFHISTLKKEKYFEIVEYLKQYFDVTYKEDIKKYWHTNVYGRNKNYVVEDLTS